MPKDYNCVMSSLLISLRQELKTGADPVAKESSKRFFKEAIQVYGWKSAEIGKLTKRYWQEIKSLPKSEVFKFCDQLWESGMMEESFIACDWAYRLHAQFEPADFRIFEKWVKNDVTNWASCDTLCNHTIGTFIEMYPQFLTELKKWTQSKNRWVKRASAVTLIIPARKGLFLDDIFEIADTLLLDSDDLVQKGYGWMLKAASQAHQTEVYEYVLKHKAEMPRTALRYAIEKMPPALKKAAMAK